MPDVLMKNFLRFSFFALASVCSIVGGPNKALSFPNNNTENSVQNNLTSNSSKSIGSSSTASGKSFSFKTESEGNLIARGQFEEVSSSINSNSDAFSDNTLADSSSANSSKSYSGNNNPASYYWYRRNKNKNTAPRAVKAAFAKRSKSFSSKFSETLSGIGTSSTSISTSETLNNTMSPISSSISSGIQPSFSTAVSNQPLTNSEPTSGSSLLTSSFSQAF